MTRKPLTIKEIKAYPASALKLDDPVPTKHGYVTVARDRDGPFSLHYQLYGQGPTKILWISGHGAGVQDFFLHVKRFGLGEGGRYTSLLLENRGINQSEGPWTVCTMGDLARDVLDVLDGVSWKGERGVHVVGHSMGGMIALRLATTDPKRIASLTLISTTSHWLKDLSLWSATKNSFSALTPKGEDARMADTRRMLFGDTWLNAPDRSGIFPTNADVWTARTVSYKVHYKGAVVQAVACVRHRISQEELHKIVEQVGGSKIQIVHGHADSLAPLSAAQTTFEGFGGQSSGVQLHVFDGVGHMAHVERFNDVVRLIENITAGSGRSSTAT